MIIRSAFLEGSVAPADRDRFDQQLAGPVVDAIRTYPGIQAVHLRRLVQDDAGSPPIYAVFDLHFTDMAAMEAALATPTRQAVRAQISQVMTVFQGRIYHQVFTQD